MRHLSGKRGTNLVLWSNILGMFWTSVTAYLPHVIPCGTKMNGNNCYEQTQRWFSLSKDTMFFTQPSGKVAMWNHFTFFSAHTKHMWAYWNMGLVNMPECQDFGCNTGTRKDSSCIFLCSSWFMSQIPGIWYICEGKKINAFSFFFFFFLLWFLWNHDWALRNRWENFAL